MAARTIMDWAGKVRSGEIDIVEQTEKALAEIEKVDAAYHVLAVSCPDQARLQAKDIQKLVKAKKCKGRLAGVLVSAKDCLCVKGVESRAGSAILQGYKPLIDATAIARLRKEGAIIIGKTTQDEFGFGSFCTNMGKGFQVPKNPCDPERVTGGSSGGAASLTKALSFPHLAVAESTGGSIVNPASFCGVAGLCPTYGLVSRWGLIDYANSLDKIGCMAKTIEEAWTGLQVMAGFDEKDATSLSNVPVTSSLSSLQGLRVGVLDESFGLGVENEIKDAVDASVFTLKEKGATVEHISLPYTKRFGVSSYYILAMAEASTNLAKYCGMRYGASEPLAGNFNDYFSTVRSAYLGDEAKRRILLGTFARMAGFRDAFYLRAATVRRLIVEEYKAIFSKVDVIISPAMPLLAPKARYVKDLSPLQQYAMDALTVGPNLAGLPHGCVPVQTKGSLPIGLMVVAHHAQEAKVASVLQEVELA